MIGWVHQLCRSWGAGQRSLSQVPLQPSLWERITSGWSIAAAAGSARRPEYPEVLTGDALALANAIRHAIAAGDFKERHWQILVLHYVVSTPNKVKIDFSGLTRKGYYKRLHRAHLALARHLPDADPPAVPQTVHNKVDTPAA